MSQHRNAQGTFIYEIQIANEVLKQELEDENCIENVLR